MAFMVLDGVLLISEEKITLICVVVVRKETQDETDRENRIPSLFFKEPSLLTYKHFYILNDLITI